MAGITIRDVAREAGVSVATVSRVLNQSDSVHEKTRRRVLEVSKALRYTPNIAARTLITSKTSTLGVLLPDLHGEFFSEVIRGIDQAAQRQAYHLLVSSSHNEKSEIEAALRAMHGRVDGLIVMSPGIDAQTLTGNLPATLPVVLLNCFVDGSSFDSLNVDNFAGAYAVVRHLTALGHQRIAFIRGSEPNYDAAERLRGYRTAMLDGEGEWSEQLEFLGNFTESAGQRAVSAILQMTPRPTAIFAANDAMAIGALSALRDAGVEVPGEIAVVGFDDIPIARFMHPPLSSVRVEISELGGRAVERLLHAIDMENTHARRQEILPTTLVVRGSCGGPVGIVEDSRRVPASPGLDSKDTSIAGAEIAGPRSGG